MRRNHSLGMLPPNSRSSIQEISIFGQYINMIYIPEFKLVTK